MELKSEGMCTFCKNKFSGRTMTKHLQSCSKRGTMNDEPKESKILLMKAGDGPFWIYFEVNANSTLKEIDDFLRSLWLECCGHLSCFIINRINYDSHPYSTMENKSMNHKLLEVFSIGDEFTHEYDFGTTTELKLKCLSEREGKSKKEITILARNELPDFQCDFCDNPAKEICTECVWDSKGLLCADCAKKHKCNEEMFLPVVNSPRMGLCGYTG